MQQAVHFLHHIRKLGIAESAKFSASDQELCDRLQALDKFLLISYLPVIAPAFFLFLFKGAAANN